MRLFSILWPAPMRALLLLLLGLVFSVILNGVQARTPGDSVAQATLSRAELPAEARFTLDLIRRGGPFPHDQDGTVFGNRERLLPRAPRGYYTEYTVRTPGVRHRGARRIVVGGDPRSSDAELWYTEDHYQSFRRILQ